MEYTNRTKKIIGIAMAEGIVEVIQTEHMSDEEGAAYIEAFWHKYRLDPAILSDTWIQLAMSCLRELASSRGAEDQMLEMASGTGAAFELGFRTALLAIMDDVGKPLAADGQEVEL